MRGRTVKLCLLAGVLLLLTGCFPRTLDELYALPAAPADYLNLQNKINEILNNGGEAIAPVSGDKIQSVQLQDLDRDGVQEAIAFFRISGDDKPLKIMIFRQVGESYEAAAQIEVAGIVINSVAYVEMDDTPGREIVVSWQISDNVHFLAAYSLDLNQHQVVELLRTNYTDFKLVDLDQDGRTEIVSLQYSAETGGRADCYSFQEGTVGLHSSANLSSGVSGVQEHKTGLLKDRVPALFVTSSLMQESQVDSYITDILAWRNGALENITLDPDTGRSVDENMRFSYVPPCTDINQDSITEVPQPISQREYMGSSLTVNYWLVKWRQFALDGSSTVLYTTYYNSRDGWFFVLPDHWLDRVIVSNNPNDVPGGSERGVVFSHWQEGDLLSEPVPFLTIYKLTGTNSEKRAKLPGRFTLLPEGGDGDVIYAARFEENGWPDCGLDEAGVAGQFHLIRTDWAAS